jgi:ATP synthase protein I
MAEPPFRQPAGGRGADPDKRLADLGERLAGAARRSAGPERSEKRGGQIGVALRLATELVAGPAVGAFIGWYLDGWLGTMPLFLLVLFVLGAVAGGLNVVRTARRMQAAAAADQPGQDGRGDG